jgi:hypothetical protein
MGGWDEKERRKIIFVTSNVELYTMSLKRQGKEENS